MLADFLWAKKSERDGKFFWLPLSQHLEDTCQVAGLLWEHWMSYGQKELILQSIGEQGNPDAGRQLMQFLGSTHDLGKATPAFQKTPSRSISADLENVLFERLERAGFENLANLPLPNRYRTKHALATQWLLEQKGVSIDISCILGGHHGKPVNELGYQREQLAYPSNYFQEENKTSSMHKKWEQAQNEIIEWALASNSYESLHDLPSVTQPAQVLLSGLVMMADWIASNERFFPLLDMNDEPEVDQQERIVQGWTAWHGNSAFDAKEFSDAYSHYAERFRSVLDKPFEPNNIQEKFFTIIDETDNPGLFILEAPMGIGKTEAALIGAEQLAYKTGRSGLFFGLPTQATSNGIFPRILSWLNNLGHDYGERFSLQLVHGKAMLNEEFTSLSTNINVDNPEQESTVITNQWFAGRKTSNLDDFVVGTVDQLLLMALKQKHLALRHLGFSRKVVVIDEVHAYDAYMNQYLQQALAWLGAYDCPVILLSATLPANVREELTTAYIGGMGYKQREIVLPPEGIVSDDYPLITYTEDKSVKQERDFDKMPNKQIEIIGLEEDMLLETIATLTNEGGIVGIIVNTVRRAQDIANQCSQIFGEDIVELLHSNFIAIERARKEHKLLDSIGKNGERPFTKIIVGTQLMEQSLDIDLDVLITDLSPMDLLIQRIGRLHRHRRERPEQHRKPRTYVLGLNDNLEFEEGSEFVYGGYLLTRTQCFLPSVINIPGDISPLVQRVYGEEALKLDNPKQKKYDEMASHSKIEIDRKKHLAQTYRLSKPQYVPKRRQRPSLVGWLKNMNPNESEEYGNAQVRDTNETVEVIALKRIGEGYGLYGEKRDISESITDYSVAKEVLANTLRLPGFLSAPRNIYKTIKELEEYNREFLDNWQSSVWLKGCLGIIFDEKDNFSIGGFTLHYDVKYGLTYEGGNNE